MSGPMKHITWFLLVTTLAFGCGRDKKAWARKIDKLVERAYACKDVACAKVVEQEIGKMIASDEEGRNLDDGEPEFLFGSAKRIRARVAELEYDAKIAKERATSPLTALEIFETTLSACHLAYVDLHDPIRSKVEQTLAKVGAKLPPDVAAKAKAPGGLLWHDELVDSFNAAMDGKVPVVDTLYTRLVGNLCIVNFRYEAEMAKADPTRFGPTVDHLAKLAEALGHTSRTEALIDAVRAAKPDKEVLDLTLATVTSIRASLAPPP